MRATKIFLIMLAVLILPLKSYAAAPEITAGKTYFNLLKGYYVLKENVRVALDNRGMKAIVTADEARVNLLSQKCWATGKVTFTHDEVIFSCEKAFLQWQTKTADVVGAVNFESKDAMQISADSATFNWSEKIADFYGAVRVKPEKNFQAADDIEIEDVVYSHVRCNVKENKILQLEKEPVSTQITIPDSDVEVDE